MGEDVYIVPTILTDDPQVFTAQLQSFPQFAKAYLKPLLLAYHKASLLIYI